MRYLKMYTILLLSSLELCYVHLLSFEIMWPADLAPPDLSSCPYSCLLLPPPPPEASLQRSIRDVLLHWSKHTTAAAWALHTSAKHIPSNTAARRWQCCVHFRSQQRRLHMAKGTTEQPRKWAQNQGPEHTALTEGGELGHSGYARAAPVSLPTRSRSINK